MRLTLVVSDCPPAGEDDPHAAPALPALSTVLRFATRNASEGDWRSALLRRIAPSAAALSPGPVAALALPGTDPARAWLATPVHLHAALDHLRMPARGLLRLDDEESHRLAVDFARVFGVDGLSLQPSRGRFVLGGLAPEPGASDAGDPADRLGSRLEAQARGGPALRRLAGEIELWLHEHPVNLARAARRRLPVSALWLWGGGAPVEGSFAAVPTASIHLAGEEAFMDGLAALVGAQAPARPDPARIAAAGIVQVSLSASADDEPRGLEWLERTWLDPVLEALRRGRLEELELMIGPVTARLRRSGLMRVWRRPRRWWEYLRR